MYIHIKNQLRLAAIILSVLLTSVSVQAKEAAKKEKSWWQRMKDVEEGKADFVRAYQEYQVAWAEAMKPESEYVSFITATLFVRLKDPKNYQIEVDQEKWKLAVLGKAKAYEGTLPRLLLALSSLSTECWIGENFIETVRFELDELLGEKLAKDQILTKASSLIKRLDSILTHINVPQESMPTWMKSWKWILFCIKNDDREAVTVVEGSYERAIEKLRAVSEAKEALAAAMQKQSEETVILEQVIALQLAVFEFSHALRQLSRACSLADQILKEVQVNLAALSSPNLSDAQILTRAFFLACALYTPLYFIKAPNGSPI